MIGEEAASPGEGANQPPKKAPAKPANECISVHQCSFVAHETLTSPLEMQMAGYLHDVPFEFQRYERLADQAKVELQDAEFFQRPRSQVNPVALIIKNLVSYPVRRWNPESTWLTIPPGQSRKQPGNYGRQT
jgi:Protein of unknown function (DUF1572)